jgi:hypothetical protein
MADRWLQALLGAAGADEDRLGDLEEFYQGEAVDRGRRRALAAYRRQALLCLAAIIRRRIRQGGNIMVLCLYWGFLACALIAAGFFGGGGDLWVLVQPFILAILILPLAFLVKAGDRFATWSAIVADLGRAQRLAPARRAAARRRAVRDGGGDFDHLTAALSQLPEPGTGRDRLLTTMIALRRERAAQRLAAIATTIRDAYALSAIAFLLGLIHLCANIEESRLTLGHLLGGALSALVFGAVLGRAVLAPMAARIGDLYSRDVQELEALRVSDDIEALLA